MLLISILLLSAFLLVPKIIVFEAATGLEWLFHLRGERPPPADIAIIAINSRSVEKLGLPLTSHWPRTVYAEVIERLQQANAHSMVMDIAFRNNRTPAEDAALSRAISQAGNVVLFKYLKRRQFSSETGIFDIEEEIYPPQDIAHGAAGIGSFTLPKHPGKVKKTWLYHELTKGVEATQPLLALMLMERDTTEDLYHWMGGPRLSGDSPERTLHTMASYFYQRFLSQPKLAKELLASPYIAGHPTRARLVYALSNVEPVHINFYGPHGTLPLTDISEVLSASAEALHSQFSGKTVYIGYADDSQTEQRDTYSTVYSGKTGIDLSGVEISATVLANLVEQSIIRTGPRGLWLLIITAAAALTLTAVSLLSFYRALLVLTLTALTYSAATVALFAQLALSLPLAAPALASCCAAVVALTIKYRRSRLREAQIVKSLEQYLPSAAARDLCMSLISIEKRHSVVYGVCMMSDVKGYTRLSERCEPDELHQMMNRYYSVLVEEVERHEGMVANIVGDSLLALWVGPSITADLCKKACLATVEIATRMQSADGPCEQLPTCFALHAGEFSLGNLGAYGHFEYSPVGDIINTTARIEKLNRALGTQSLISDMVLRNLPQPPPPQLSARYLGRFELHNKSEGVELASFDFPQMDIPRDQADIERLFSDALRLYQAGDVSRAKALFSKLVQSRPEDGPCQYYFSKCG